MKSYEITDKGYYYLGQSSLESNQLNDALKWLKLGLKQYEAIDPIKLALEANANVKDKKLTEASELYEKLVEHYTIGTKICSAMTMIYVAQESAKDVFQCEVTLIEINSFNIMAHLNKGYILREQGKLNEALKCYNIAIELNLEYAKKCHEDNANVIANNPLADKYYESLIVRNDSCDKKSHLMGDSLYKIKKYDEAKRYYDLEIELNNKCAIAYQDKSSVLQKQGNRQEAKYCYNKALGINKDIEQLKGALQNNYDLDKTLDSSQMDIESLQDYDVDISGNVDDQG